jgi:hypothetical protein
MIPSRERALILLLETSELYYGASLAWQGVGRLHEGGVGAGAVVEATLPCV